MQFKLTAAVVALAIAGASHTAHAGALTRFTEETTKAVLVAAGATDIKSSTVDNDPRLTFTVDKVVYVADHYACKGSQGCELLQFAVSFEASPTDTVEAVNAFNAKYMYGKAYLDAKRDLASVRTINGRAGSSTEQAAAELQDFLGATKRLLEHMKQSGATASYVPEVPAPAFALGGQQGQSGRRPPPLNKR
jgi:hypothetical protein